MRYLFYNYIICLQVRQLLKLCILEIFSQSKQRLAGARHFTKYDICAEPKLGGKMLKIIITITLA